MATELNAINDVIARRELTGVTKSGEKLHIIIEIGKPFTGKAQSWRCPVAVQPLTSRTYEISGEDSFQALSLAISFAYDQLVDFVNSGGRLFYPDTNEEFHLDEPFLKL